MRVYAGAANFKASTARFFSYRFAAEEHFMVVGTPIGALREAAKAIEIELPLKRR